MFWEDYFGQEWRLIDTFSHSLPVYWLAYLLHIFLWKWRLWRYVHSPRTVAAISLTKLRVGVLSMEQQMYYHSSMPSEIHSLRQRCFPDYTSNIDIKVSQFSFVRPAVCHSRSAFFPVSIAGASPEAGRGGVVQIYSKILNFAHESLKSRQHNVARSWS